MKPKSKILIIAGSDSSGGSGIQADIKTVTALGSYAMTAITAVTSQNTTGVKSIVALDPKEILNQILFTSKDIKPDGVKMYIVDQTNPFVYQFTTSTSEAITITWDADIEWGNGTAPDSPASGQKDLYTITTDDGGTTYFGVPSGVAFS